LKHTLLLKHFLWKYYNC